jgi:hypothetical protein
MKILLILFAAAFISCKTNTKGKDSGSLPYRNPIKDSAFLQAKMDLEKDSLKYFYQGIASSSPKLAHYLWKKHKITVINRIDVSDKKDSYYNEFTDSVLVSREGKRFNDLFKEIR